MSDENNTPMAGAAAPASESETTINSWELRAAAMEKDEEVKDLHVQVTVPLFHNVTVLATILAPESVELGEGEGEAVRLRFRFEEPVKTEEGHVKAPGYVYAPRAFALMPGRARDEKTMSAVDRGRRDLGAVQIAAKVLKRGEEPVVPRLIRNIGALEGKKVVLRFSTAAGSKRDEEGNFTKFQNVRFAAAGESGKAAPADENY